MTDKALFTFEEGQFVGHIELIRMPVVFRASAISQSGVGIVDVVVRRSEATNRRTPREQFRVYVEKLGISVSGLKLQAVAHALLRLHDEGVVVGADTVRAVVEAGIEPVRTNWAQ